MKVCLCDNLFVYYFYSSSLSEIILIYDLFEDALNAYNEKEPLPFDLYISKGIAFFDRKVDRSYTDVFNRADEDMYHNKEEFYKEHPKIVNGR